MQETYDPAAVERAAQQYWQERRAFEVRRERRAAEVLLPVDAAVPFRTAAHGARAQLHHRRRAGALPAHAGLQRAAAHGLGRLRPAGRERRHQQRRAAGAVDAAEHRAHARAAQVPWLRHRLAARARHLRSAVLPLEPVAVPAHARAGTRVPPQRHRQLGSRRSDGARQRAGHRRPRLAHRRAGGEARDSDVLPRHHALRRGAAALARRHARLARARAGDAGQLDRPQRGLRHRLSLCARHGARHRRRRGTAGVHHAAPTRCSE